MNRIYLDHNATSPLRDEVRRRYLASLEEGWGNPSSVHTEGRAARARLDDARERVAAALRVHEDEVVFTSSATEAIHMAVLGARHEDSGRVGVVTSAVEHSAVLGAVEIRARTGIPSIVVPVDDAGRVARDEVLARASDPRVALVSLQLANNEVGTLQPVAEIASGLAGLGRARPLVHSDAVQALGRVPLDVRGLEVDFASFSAHKVGGPLGVGVLYKRMGRSLVPLMEGGGQEVNLRPGTENMPAIDAAAFAIELAVAEQHDTAARFSVLGHAFWSHLRSVVPSAALNGPPADAADRLANTWNVSLPVVDGRTLVARLDLEGLSVSAGSACASGSLEPSHVLLAMGRARDAARAAIRVSFGRSTTIDDVHNAVDILRRTVESSS